MRCFIFAGEHSGDLHASALMKAMRQKDPDTTFCGVGGPLMQQEGLSSLFPFEDFQVFGITEIIRRFPSLYRRFYQTRDWILQHKPDCVILVDYPGWNLRLGKALRKGGYTGRIIYYIAPTVWAWAKWRVKTLEKFADLVLLIFPFEKPFFAQSPFTTEFVGHPLVERIDNTAIPPNWKESFGIRKETPCLALFPGSRLNEVRRLFPRMLEIVRQLKTQDPERQVLISSADSRLETEIKSILAQASLEGHPDYILVPSNHRYAMMQAAQAALAKSGTITLELALLGVPSAVVYDISYFDRLIAQYIIRPKLDFFCIVNIIAGHQVYPEWIARPFSTAEVVKELSLLQKGSQRARVLADCRKVQEQLRAQEGKTASEKAAEAIFLKLASNHV